MKQTETTANTTTTIKSTFHSDHYYILLKINYTQKLYTQKVEPLINKAIEKCFGETGKLISDTKIINYNPSNQNLILRCQKDSFSAIWAAMSLFHDFENHPCYLEIIKVSPWLLSLANKERFSVSRFEDDNSNNNNNNNN
ncbi:hypothetical protein CYY_006128 [Polysphondylium violaceum]|uniref:Uncharacterized protein n=1 Tax=Polysphondylium violaceum TaxID=133409 RepID=A0A8J4UZ67_9MYCE|nr:hypothetical protein CYY_006128 [Polysphondylium violaceum]